MSLPFLRRYYLSYFFLSCHFVCHWRLLHLLLFLILHVLSRHEAFLLQREERVSIEAGIITFFYYTLTWYIKMILSVFLTWLLLIFHPWMTLISTFSCTFFQLFFLVFQTLKRAITCFDNNRYTVFQVFIVCFVHNIVVSEVCVFYVSVPFWWLDELYVPRFVCRIQVKLQNYCCRNRGTIMTCLHPW